MKLHMKSKLISIHAKMDILDEEENVVYTVASKAISIHNTTYLKNAAGKEVATITRKPLTVHEVHYVEMATGPQFELRTELLHFTKDIIQVEELGWTLQGNFTEHHYKIIDSSGRILASSSMKWFSMHNIFYLDIEDEAHADTIVALFVTLQRIIQERIATASAAGSSTTSTTTNN